MSKLSKYNDFLIEKEFKSIVKDILTLVESNTYEWDLTDKEDKLSAGDTVEWDIPSKKNSDVIKDEPSKEIVWDFEKDVEQQSKNIKDYVNSLRSGASKVKSGFGKVKSKILKYRDYLNEGDPDIEFDVNSVLFNKIKEFIKGLDTKEQAKKYFFKLIEELKELPYKVKKDLFVKLSLLIMTISSLPIGDLISDQDANKDKFLNDVKIEVSSNKVEETKPIENKEEVKGGASFVDANKLVSFAEGGYTDNAVDAGNYTGSGRSGYLIGTNHGIAAFTLIKTDIKPTSDVEIKALKQSYGKRYEELCGSKLLSFGEQWRLDQKYINSKDIGVKWKNIMMSLQKETATEIYETEYWNPQQFSKIKSQSIANILYDACVNQGSGGSKKVYVKSMEELGHNTDGVKGWKSAHEKLTPIVNSMDKSELKKLHHVIKENRREQYKSGKTTEEIEEFSKGWDNRLAMDINTFDEEGDIS
jgi:lysozyme family protein